MPMQYVYTCAHCGKSSNPVGGVPEGWFTVNIPADGDTPPHLEYFDTWNCVSVYAGEHVPAK